MHVVLCFHIPTKEVFQVWDNWEMVGAGFLFREGLFVKEGIIHGIFENIEGYFMSPTISLVNIGNGIYVPVSFSKVVF